MDPMGHMVRVRICLSLEIALEWDRWWQVDDGYISKPELIEFPTANGETAYGFYYPPSNCDFEAPEGPEGEAGAPPLLVKAHGGPTAQTSIVFNPALQFWTSRGFAVLPGGEGYISFFHPGNSRDGFSTYVLRMSFSLYLEVFLFECPGHELSCSQISRVSTTDFIFQAELQWRSQRFLDDFWAWHVAKIFCWQGRTRPLWRNQWIADSHHEFPPQWFQIFSVFSCKVVPLS